MPEDWSKKEVALIVHAYFEMLAQELKGQSYNKSEYRHRILPLLNHRSEGSIEFKHQNISAVLAGMGLPFIRGYKPRGNYQQLLEDELANYMQGHRTILEKSFETFSNATPRILAKDVDISRLLGDAPQPSLFNEEEPKYRPIKINYLEREQNNRKLGEEGEQLVIEYERYRLLSAGKNSLADKIEWVAKEKGDGTGFDILSKNENGSDRYIEVKTTKLPKETPIYITKTEVSFAALKKSNFYLYRLYNFDSMPKMFIKNGEYTGYCKLAPQSFKGYF